MESRITVCTKCNVTFKNKEELEIHEQYVNCMLEKTENNKTYQRFIKDSVNT